MTDLQIFSFNPFQENTYIIYDETRECVIVDPGCYLTSEEATLKKFIEDAGLKPVRLLNTHCHLDHVFGNKFAADTWQLGLEIHSGEQPVLDRYLAVAQSYGIPNAIPSPAPSAYLEDGGSVVFGNTRLDILLVPGHSPASIAFYCEAAGFVLAGDVLFFESIGNTNFPGGHLPTLLHSIRTRLFTLPDPTVVYPGHGHATTIRHEKEYNPFLNSD